ncbi:MAG: ABC transporter substrate-binding protein [Peptococcales bacterium]|jgi:glycine betaine/proline transport system substrate-binding protein
MSSILNKKLWRFFLVTFCIIALLSFTACSKVEQNSEENAEIKKDKPTLVFADAGWDSIQFHNAVAQYIIEKGYGYQTDVMPGSTPITFNGLQKGDIDIYMEVWTTNISNYNEAITEGSVVELSINFDDNAQGLYVPTYLITGDTERGIEPKTPDLKTIQDLPKYWELFKDPEDKSKGRIFGAIPGWEADRILGEKIKNYGLDETYSYFSPGSDAALAASMAKAYENGEPWVGYYWEPTWVMGLYDMTLLEDEKYNDELWENGYRCEFPPVPVTVAVNKDVLNDAPDVVEFLKNYQTSSALTSEALAYMQENGTDAKETAQWFIKNYEDLWTKWVPQEIADKVKRG